LFDARIIAVLPEPSCSVVINPVVDGKSSPDEGVPTSTPAKFTAVVSSNTMNVVDGAIGNPPDARYKTSPPSKVTADNVPW
jgi:hypothetical protein